MDRLIQCRLLAAVYILLLVFVLNDDRRALAQSDTKASEPDVAAMIGEIRDVRDGYRKDLQGILSKDQYTSYLAQIDGILTSLFKKKLIPKAGICGRSFSLV